jgi:EAL domain-containing protein (putative c-di-GMP-specific phosphodiesterase class I)
LTVVAEGVENLAACPQLNRMGTDVVQGFGISRPMPASLLTTWLQSREQSPADPRSLRAV